jgi:hypothetical protein
MRIDVGCSLYFDQTAPGVTDGDEYSLYVRVRAFEYREESGQPLLGEWHVGPWSEETEVVCRRRFYEER